MSKVLELTMDLVSRASITPHDAGCQQQISERLCKSGFELEKFHSHEVSNILLTHGQQKPALWFLGHTDVVPSGPIEDWTSPPFEPEVREEALFGRGVADMKGAVAAMVVALEDFATAHPHHAGSIGLLLTSDEEGLATNGIRYVAAQLKNRGQSPDHCLVGEPSSQEKFGDTVRIGRRGSICARLQINGVQGHTALPLESVNPVHQMAPFLADLTAKSWDEGDENFPPTLCQVSNFTAGTGAENVTPGHVILMFNIRNSPSSSAEDLRCQIEAMLQDHDIDSYQLDWRVSGEPFRSEAGDLRASLIQSIGQHLDVHPDLNTGGGTSDGRFIAPLGTEVVEFGLLNKSIHQVDENALVADLEKLRQIYFSVMENLLSD